MDISDVRKLRENNLTKMNFMFSNILDNIKQKLIDVKIEGEVSGLKILPTNDEQGVLTFIVGDVEYTMSYIVETDSMVLINTPEPTQTEESVQEVAPEVEAEVEAPTSEPEMESETEGETMEAEAVEGEDMTGELVKITDGSLAVVTAIKTEGEKTLYTIKTATGEEKEVEGQELTEAKLGDLFTMVLAMGERKEPEQTENDTQEQAQEREVARIEETLAKKEDIVDNNYRMIANSPVIPERLASNPAVDVEPTKSSEGVDKTQNLEVVRKILNI